MSKQPSRKTGSISLVITLWVIGISTGVWLMLNHEFESGSLPEAPNVMPKEIRQIVGHSKPFTLVMAIHPDCPCTRASIEELDRFLVRNPDRVQVLALFHETVSENGESTTTQSAYWDQVSRLPSTKAILDREQTLLNSLGAMVSGTAVLYDDQDQLRFRGGLTASRGHSGSSVGGNILANIAQGSGDTQFGESPAFGCSLKSEANLEAR